MKTLIGFEEIEDKIITLRGQKVLLDRDVATLYGVETKRVNEALRNNLDKFPKDYCFCMQSYYKKVKCGKI
jgi:predicted XRE-type DNA-binding protein